LDCLAEAMFGCLAAQCGHRPRVELGGQAAPAVLAA
jgi:hypothetical protein